MPQQGQRPEKALRAHSATLIGQKIYVVGGCDRRGCWRGMCTFNTESLVWAKLCTTGATLPPLRAHTTTAVGRNLYIFGGGDGPTYSNDVWVFGTREWKARVVAGRWGRLILGVLFFDSGQQVVETQYHHTQEQVAIAAPCSYHSLV